MSQDTQIREAERTGDIQAQVRLLLRVNKPKEAGRLLKINDITDIWFLGRFNYRSRLDSSGNGTYYCCPHCAAPSEYNTTKVYKPIECPKCSLYYVDCATSLRCFETQEATKHED